MVDIKMNNIDYQKVIDWIKQNWILVVIILIVIALVMRMFKRRRIIIE
ncbi:MAG: hypothetical protein QXO75_03420 [Nitrososphaerota archaeon]